MQVFLTGASGFLGSRLAAALRRRDHRLVCAMRTPPRRDPPAGCRVVAADFTRDHDAADWRARVASSDVVVNAVGILREHGSQRFDALHVAAPKALFAGCVEAGVRRVIQVSALGADRDARSRYHLSKREADDFLAAQPLDWTIVQPSLVYGPGGASSRLFDMLASLPATPLPGDGRQPVQPIHVDDFVAAVVALIEGGGCVHERLALVGPEPLALRGFLAELRRGMRLGDPRFLSVPMPAMRFAASAGRALPGGFLDPETLDMLVRGNTGDPRATRLLLGAPPRPAAAFVAADTADGSARLAQLGWLLTLLRISVAAVWFTAGAVSLGIYPVEDSYALLGRAGITGMLAPPMLYGAALADLALGVATLWPRRPRALWWLQIALVLGYTMVISLRLPEFWLHPYGPVVKNLPFLVALWMLALLDRPAAGAGR